MKTPRHLAYVMPTLLMAACAPGVSRAPTSGPFVRGTARVISVDANAGHAVLDLEGHRVEAYWQTEVAAAQGGSIMQQDANRAPVGIYREPEVRNPAFEAKPGDTIAFIGMQTGNSIFLQGISVVNR